VTAQTIELKITGMHCAACVSTVERALYQAEGVKKAVVNLMLEKARIEGEVEIDRLIQAIQKTGYEAELIEEIVLPQESQPDKGLIQAKNQMVFAWIPSVIMMMWMIPKWLSGIMWPNPTLYIYGMIVLSLVVLLLPGRDIFRSAWQSTAHLTPNMDVLIALGSLACLVTGVLKAFGMNIHSFAGIAGMIISFHLTGRYIELKARGRSFDAMRLLLNLGAKNARIIVGSEQREIPVSQIKSGDIMHVLAGEKIPTDGIIIDGKSTIDESITSGESTPIIKTIDDHVIGATINLDGVLKVKATKVGRDTFIAQMAKMVEEAQTTKVPIQAFADRVTAVFVPIVLALAMVTFSFWMIAPDFMRIGTQFFLNFFPWINPDVSGTTMALFAAVAVLVIACPCALGLATPTALMVGSGKGAENGILIRSGAAIQRMSEVTTIVLDKTGTLTAGRPEVMQVELLEGENETELIRMAASVEKNSIHPLAKAIVRFAQGKQIGLNDVTDIFSTPGKGMEATLDNSKIKVGNREYVGYQGDFDAHGSHVFMAVDDTVYGVFVLQDQIRADSNSLVQYLNNKQYKTVMLTGDKANVAEVMANEIGIEKVFSEVMPSDKLKTVQSIQESGEVVCMIGDGINDAPALAQADVGIAMGTGADIAMESGDIILIRGDLSKVKKAISLSNKTFRKIRQNLFWASIYNLIAIPMAIFGVLHPILAEAIMAFSSINVVWNSTRLRYETL
ncbi:uncharacterized protein METZ01_LOCUS81388, partial [marine metagenome]